MAGRTEQKMDLIERDIYALICSSDGIRAKEIAKKLNRERSVVNHYLYASPYMHDLCYRDRDYNWHGYIRQTRPHTGLGDFSGYYGTVKEFLALAPEEWFRLMQEGCRNIGRNLNDTRGLFHSFRDTGDTMRALFADLEGVDTSDWEIVFELRIKKSRHIRIYADVLVITERYVFSLEFKMKDRIEEEEVFQASKYSQYIEVLFGPDYDVIPVLVLTRASDLYCYVQMKNTTGELPVCSGDMLFNIFDEYLGGIF
ncbi:MAG: helix-turn-helix domain containing protein [Lachnospiraceae bacterium]|nr:helix-turn-helix domain containing protein [Lachnospiraceae bacterium]